MLETHADRVNSENPANVQCAPLGNGQKEAKVHLKSLNVRNGSFRSLLTAASKGRYSVNILIVILSILL